ncbi:MAG: DNA-binding protein [Meiothermus sp.]
MEKTERRTYTVAEVVEILGVSRITVLRRVRDGTIPSIRLGRRVLIPAEYVDELLKKWRKEGGERQ